MLHTVNYSLAKPEDTDYADQSVDINASMDTIDTQLKTNADNITAEVTNRNNAIAAQANKCAYADIGLSVDQSIATTNKTTVALDTIVGDSVRNTDIVSGIASNVVTIAASGLYVVSFTTNPIGIATGNAMECQVYRNANILMGQSNPSVFNSADEYTELNCSCVTYLAAGDTLKAEYRTNATAATTSLPSAASTSHSATRLGIMRIRD